MGLKNLPTSEFLDVAKSVRVRVKDKKNDRSGGKLLQYLLFIYYIDF